MTGDLILLSFAPCVPMPVYSTSSYGLMPEFQEARSLGRVTVDPRTSAILEYTFTWTSGPSKGKVTHDTILSMGFTDRIG
ncbi:hypothetical protein EES39_22735 [Streptomyces sp. ADI92-24]|uniref:hypothetical protein n=1 Tax=Streptomyces sp. ADI92-24 TaxID=1522756 RepID=UPI000F550A06|nr:hypothetical protein [Streptomyces sp. ADI92-24]RPK41173.1 hypothetical protein EES39_22735 [Streptomyces sp. ADI92-24]